MKATETTNKVLVNFKSRFEFRHSSSWVKSFVSFDDTQANGYKYVGDFIENATKDCSVEVDPGYYICNDAWGAQRNPSKDCFFIRIDENGSISELGRFRGSNWAVEAKEFAKNLLEEKKEEAETQVEEENPLASISTEALIAELERRKYAVEKIVEVTTEMEESEMQADIETILERNYSNSKKSMAIARMLYKSTKLRNRATWAESLKEAWNILKSN